MTAEYEMKDSGVEWIGKIPKRWEICRLKMTVKHKNVVTQDSTGYIGLENIQGGSGRFIPSSDDNFKAEGQALVIKPGNVIFGKLRPYLAKCYLVQENGCCSSEFLVLEEAKLKAYYLKYLMLSPSFITEVNMATYGTKMPRANWEIIGNIRVPYPSLHEQTAIASYLDDKCSAIDDVIAQAKETIEEYKSWKASVIFEAVTKGLDPNVEMKDSGVEWIGEIPKHWNCLKAKRVFQSNKNGIKVGPFGSALTNAVVSSDEGTIKIYGQANLIRKDFEYGNNYVTNETYQRLKEYEVLSNDVLVSMMGTIGKCCVVPTNIITGIMDSHLIKVRINEKMTPAFFEYIYESQAVFKQLLFCSKGSIMNGLNSGIVKNVFMTVPPLPEQTAIASYLDDKCSAIDSIISEKQVLIDELESYKKSLIFETVTGKRRVC